MIESRHLIDRIISGDREAFRLFVEQYQRLVGHIVFRMIDNKDDREDICQEVFLKVYQNLGEFKFQSLISTWVGAIAYNTSVNYLQKKKHQPLDILQDDEGEADNPDTLETPPDDQMEQRDLSFNLHREIEKIPPHYRTVLTLYHLDEMTYEEIGLIMKMPEGTVKSYLFRARKILKERLLVKYTQEDLCR
jgi:RNA polymerase sigma-70 factor, ECF subfamily